MDFEEKTLQETFVEDLGNIFLGKAIQTEEEVRAEKYRKLCRNGNPFPLIAYQWPDLVIEGKDAEFFDGSPGSELDPCLRIDRWQRLIIRSFFDDSIGEIYIKGCTGAGKGACVAIAVNLWFDVYDDGKTILTGPTFSHVQSNFYRECKLRRMGMNNPAPASILQASFQRDGHALKIVCPRPVGTSDRQAGGEEFSGAHSENTLYVFDEATKCHSKLFDNAEKNARKIVALGNPRTHLGHFRFSFSKLREDGQDEDQTGICMGTIGRRLCVTISDKDCSNVKFKRLKKPFAPIGGIKIGQKFFNEGERIVAPWVDLVRPLIPNQIDTRQSIGIRSKPNPDEVRIFADGMFPLEDPEVQVIVSSWLARHEDAWKRYGQNIAPTCFAVDVARSERGDYTVLTAGNHMGIHDFYIWRFNNSTFHCKKILEIARKKYGIDLRKGKHPLGVDMGGGYGSGVADPLGDQGVWIMEFNPSGRSEVNPHRYANMRAESYATLARRLDPNDSLTDTPFALPPNDRLRMELVAPEKIYSPGDMIRFRIEPKEIIKEKLQGKSPDVADSVCIFFWVVREYYDINRLFMEVDAEDAVGGDEDFKYSDKSYYEDEYGEFKEDGFEGEVDTDSEPMRFAFAKSNQNTGESNVTEGSQPARYQFKRRST